jgi:peroxiredoxin
MTGGGVRRRAGHLVAAAGIAAVGAVLTPAWTGTASATEQARARAAAAHVNNDEWAGRDAPDFALKALDGRTLRLVDFRGKVLLLNFWATWCTPCRREMPWLVDLQKRYRARGMEVAGVSLDDGDAGGVAKFAEFMHVNYPILLKDGVVGDAYGGARYLPQTFFIGRDGKILAHTVGVRSRAEFEADLVRALHRRAAES